MKKIAFTIVLTLFLFSFSNAQDYKTGIGLRGGFDNGVTIKHFVSSKAAFEGIIASRWEGLEITGLYEIHGRAFQTDRLNWYAGFGGHIGFWDGNNAKWGDDEKSYTVIGIDGILGMEYNFVEIPFNLSVDWKPAFNLFGYSGFWGGGGALSIRYIF
ncbi:MAG: hypothetical protein ACQESM_06465 [Bacteroidota bacterium]